MKSALVILLIAQVVVVPTMTRNVAFNHFLEGKRCPSPACDGQYTHLSCIDTTFIRQKHTAIVLCRYNVFFFN